MPVDLVPVAQYLRMSTDHQEYSLDNQADAIAVYAADHGFRVVKTYSDVAKSGLRLTNRIGLKQLLKDVVEGAEFCAVLVFDVSRWGRFQDTDEAAHYEYVCKSAGIPVHYCAETFANDNSIPGSIMKALKRSMAGEYSRELSVKVRSGLARLTRMGYKAGGSPTFGLRRALLDVEGKPKQLLSLGQRKSLVTERVIVVPGPPKEVATVRRIFREFAIEYRSCTSIAKRLNQEKVLYFNGAWDAGAVTRVLRHPHYAGTQIWGKTRWYLGGKAKRVPAEEWIVCQKAFEPIISNDLFEKAQSNLAGLTCHLSDEEMIERLRNVWRLEGRLSAEIIEQSLVCPSLTSYYKRFGGILEAYKKVGYPHAHLFAADATRQRGWIVRQQVMEELVRESQGRLYQFRPSGRRRILLRSHRTGLLISVLLARFQLTAKGQTSWSVDPRINDNPRLTALVLLDETNRIINKLFVFRRLPGIHRFTVRPESEFLQKGLLVDPSSKLLDAVHEVRMTRNIKGSGTSQIRNRRF
jgi:DNA invertase Pin-like site-specific DNA recombinase